jgi:NADP-dependent 3-hydroxy acid dehydrogenase YdfG
MILITGITGGIGNYLFNSFLNNGEEIIGTYHLNKPEGEQYKNCVQLDITDNIQVEKFAENIAKQSKNITLINCAGISYNSFAHKSNADEWTSVIT